ncbi:MAG: glycosyl hydrolase family 57 [Deltaproteobacteria bacterium]|jgi:hypothetical protein|nr:glycosyl hydrolase family 57 [Deltaproteobacteria bacterium]
MATIPETLNNLPCICGFEKEIEEATTHNLALYSSGADFDSDIAFDNIKSCATVALHMQQPLIPAGSNDLQSAEIISNLKYMFEHLAEGDNHNAGVFKWCYERLGEFIPQLVAEGKKPRIMLEYTGCLLYGLRQMGANEVIEKLQLLVKNYSRNVEWLGCPWGHAVAPSTPVQDYKLQVRAWQHYFAGLFGLDALARVKGFSPSEMALPNHPDIAYEFVRTLKECGFLWVLVQEHTVERPENGYCPELRHFPHRLVCRNSKGEEASIICLIKTQGSDTKLVAQMQPWYEAICLQRLNYQNKSLPQIVTQIADGENGGVMMNEFPPKYLEVVRNSSDTETPLVNGTEYLEYLFSQGLTEMDFPVLQPIMQKRIWERFTPGDGPEKLQQVIEDLKKEDGRFHLDGGSWTNNISWVHGYDSLLGPMERASSVFFEQIVKKGVPTNDKKYQTALFYLLCSQTSCYRYWGQGIWTDYGREICRRAIVTMNG